MAVFSVTDRRTFRRCRRMWDYSSNARKNLTGIGSGPEPLELGGLIHRALADWIVDYFINNEENAKKPGYLAALFVTHASERQIEVTRAFEERTREKISPQYLESLHNVVMLGTEMMKNYQEYHKSPLPEHMTFASPEQEVLVPVPGTEHPCSECLAWATRLGTVTFHGTNINVAIPFNPECTECGGKGYLQHYLSMTLDGLVQDEKERFFILEHKTYENRPKPMDLAMDDQFTGYCWGTRQLKIGKVMGVAYDGMWKRPKPPKYMQRDKCPGQMSDLFIRKTIPKSDAELDAWGENLALEINEMANDPAIYPNVPWSGCSDCSFQEICYMQMRGEDPSKLIQMRYTQREIVRGGKK